MGIALWLKQDFDRTEKLRASVYFWLTALLTASPWFVRNWHLFGDPFFNAGSLLFWIPTGREYHDIFDPIPTMASFFKTQSLAHILHWCEIAVKQRMYALVQHFGLVLLFIFSAGILSCRVIPKPADIVFCIYVILTIFVTALHDRNIVMEHYVSLVTIVYFYFSASLEWLLKKGKEAIFLRTVVIGSMAMMAVAWAAQLARTVPTSLWFFQKKEMGDLHQRHYEAFGKYLRESTDKNSIIMTTTHTSAVLLYGERAAVGRPMPYKKENDRLVINKFAVTHFHLLAGLEGARNPVPDNFYLEYSRNGHLLYRKK